MKRFLLPLLFILFGPVCMADYGDHRGHNVDSLERVVAAWPVGLEETASPEQAPEMIKALEELAYGYLQINGVKSDYYARKCLALARRMNEFSQCVNMEKIIGQIHWASERYDSAAFYYSAAVDDAAKMAASPASEDNPDGFSQREIDNVLSQMYGTLGNLYITLDSLALGMDYYAKAGELFDKYDWKESNAILWSNMGDTWMEQGDFKQSEDCFLKAIQYGTEADDSLLTAVPKAGLGSLYMKEGRTAKALKYLREADQYFSNHEDQEFRARIETLDVMGRALEMQKRTMTTLAIAAIALALLLALTLILLRKLRLGKKALKETETVLEETLEEIPAPGSDTTDIKLNDREKEILKMLSEGLETAQISDKLCLGNETIKWYRKRLRAKFGVTSTAALVAEAIRRGII